jgi:hypothetical protein
MFCENCGNKLPDGAKFCGGCGAKVEPAQAAPQRPVQPPPPPVNTPPVQSAQPRQQAYIPPQPAVRPETEPLRVSQYLGMLLLLCIPIVNIVLLFVWGFGSSVNVNKKNYARAVLILAAIGIVLSILFSAAITSMFLSMFNNISYY